MSAGLPRDSVAHAAGWPKCPWCKADCSAATVDLESLQIAFETGSLERAHRAPGNVASPEAACSACPSCERPFMVALQRDRVRGASIRLLAVRTAKDLRLAECEPRSHREAGA